MANEVVTNPSTVDTVGTTVTNVTDTLKGAFIDYWTRIAGFAPKLIAAIVVMLAGYFIAKWVARIVTMLCERWGLQNAAERGGLAKSMAQVGIRKTIPAIVGTLAFWLLLCVFLTATFNLLGLSPLVDAMQSVVSFIPHLIVATVVVVVGLLIAAFLRGVIATSADRVGLTYAEQLATGCYYLMAAMVFITASKNVKLDVPLLDNLILIAAGGLSIGFALALGLGGRDVVSGILAGYYLRQRLQTGDHVTVGHLEGTVRDVGPTATVIETDEDGLISRRSIPNSKMLNEAVR